MGPEVSDCFHRYWSAFEREIIRCRAGYDTCTWSEEFHPIERQWAPRSRDLSGIILPACLPGESDPPAKQTQLTLEQREEKQKAVHKAAAEQLCGIRNGKTYDKHPVVAIAVPIEQANKEGKKLDDFLDAGIRRLREDETLTSMRNEFAFLLGHANRSTHLLSFVKCEDKSCSHCTSKPVHAETAVKELCMFHGQTLSSQPSQLVTGHYSTYLESVDLVHKQNAVLPDQHLPSKDGVIHRCKDGCRYVFRSAGDPCRHEVLAHPNQRSARMARGREERRDSCRHRY